MQTIKRASKEQRDINLTIKVMEHLQVKGATTEKNKEMEKNIKLKTYVDFIGNRWELNI